MTDPETYNLSQQAAAEYDKAVHLIGEFTELHEVQRIVHWMLAQCAHISNENKFANVTAAMAAFTRAVHDLEASLVLCQVHCYTQALGMLRSVHEAAGLGRTVALSPSMKIADEWIRGKWQPDYKARQFVRNVMFADADVAEIEAAVAAYTDAYDLLSQWAHITVNSALTPYVGENEHGFTFKLTPQFDEDFLVFTLNATIIFGVYLSYAVRNSIAPEENQSSEWRDVLQRLDTHKDSLTAIYVPQLVQYAKQAELRSKALVESIRNSSEFRRHLRNS